MRYSAMHHWLLAALCLPRSTTVASWVDPDTPEAGRTTQPLTETDQRQYELVGSSERIVMELSGSVGRLNSTHHCPSGVLR